MNSIVMKVVKLEGRILMKMIKMTGLKAACVTALAFAFGVIAIATDGTRKAEAAEAADPVTSNVTETPIAARDALTYSEDRKLTNSCIDAGFSKNECLCVTKVTKFETSLDDYRALVTHYTRPAKMIAQTTTSGDPLTPQQSGQTDMLRLIESPNFEYRCADADRYFEVNRTP